MRNANDFYPTPHSIIQALLENLDWEPGQTWEPCAGDGRLVEALLNRGHTVVASDIAEGYDFFEYRAAPVSTLITNPPFKKIRPFIDHAFRIGVERMALVCAERLWACNKGHIQFDRHRPSRFINLTWREDYLNRGGSPDRALAISIWDRPHSETCQFEVWGKPGVEADDV